VEEFRQPVVDDSNRTKLANKLLNYGQRVQYSVFECQLTNEKLAQMKKDIMEYIDIEEDSLRIYKLCQKCCKKMESIGIKKGYESEKGPIIV
jgi:CRISPR-associated protein Cas2